MHPLKVCSRFFSNSPIKLVQAKNLKGKKLSSQQWLQRQLSDPYVEKAKILNYRCRSAFKLLEIDERFKVLKPGQTVIDCGAAPGSWSQIAVRCVNSSGTIKNCAQGTVISIDKQQFYPIEGAIILGNSDFTQPETIKKIETLLNGSKADVVLSDMAPNATGINVLDTENILKLCYSVLRFAILNSKHDATLIVKLWQCGETKNLQNDIEKFYKNVKIVKPDSSRADSAEIFLLGRNFKGIKIDG